MAVLQLDWDALLKIYGPLGVGCAIAIVLVKVLLNYIKKQHESNLEDARKERDYARQLRERETEKFLESLRMRDEKMERGFSEIIIALHRRDRES